MIFTALHETFITYLKVAFFAAMFMSSPIILTQIWKFVAPGLYKNEKKALLPYLIATPTLFFLGGMLVYYLIMPLAIKFFLSFETSNLTTSLPIQLEAKVNEYLSLIMRLIFAFGLSFQLPVILSLLARIGFLDSEYLKKRRKYVVIIIFAAAALLTPPDPITQIGLAIPLLILYELSILSVKIIEKRKIMHDIKLIRKNSDFFFKKLSERNSETNIKVLLNLDEKNRDLIQKIEKLEQEKKSISQKKDKSKFDRSKEISLQASKLSNEQIETKEKINSIMHSLPNIAMDMSL